MSSIHSQGRRDFLKLGLAASAMGLLAACGNAASPSSAASGTSPAAGSQAPSQAASSAAPAASPATPSTSAAASAKPAASAAASPVATPQPLLSSAGCVLSPEQTEGPYYIDTGLMRADITEGKPGLALRLHLTVQSANSCKALPGTTVEVWHCDAGGVYSGYGSAGSAQAGGAPPAAKPAGGPAGGGGGHVPPTNKETFLRGGQTSGAGGSVVFDTIYPGWYQGRTTHIHVRVHAGGQTVHTGQLYMSDAINDEVYAQQPYAAHGKKPLANEQDGIYRDGGPQSMLALSKTGAGYAGAITLGVKA